MIDFFSSLINYWYSFVGENKNKQSLIFSGDGLNRILKYNYFLKYTITKIWVPSCFKYNVENENPNKIEIYYLFQVYKKINGSANSKK